jgi:hypothetical protein
MGALQDHQTRVSKLRDGLNRLLALHQKLHALHSEGQMITRARQGGQERRIQALREEAQGVLDEIDMLRESLDTAGTQRR